MTAVQVLDSMLNDPSIKGQSVDVDHEFGGQCWDLVELFAERCGVPKEPWAIPLGPNGWASEAWTAFEKSPHMQKYFTKIPAGQTQRGDILVYAGHGPYVEGHIAIDNGSGTVFEENADPDGSPAHTANRATTYLLGGLRINKGDDDMPASGEEVTLAFLKYQGSQPTKQQYVDYTTTIPRWGLYRDLADELDDENNASASGEEVTRAFLAVQGKEPSRQQYVFYTTQPRHILYHDLLGLTVN